MHIYILYTFNLYYIVHMIYFRALLTCHTLSGICHIDYTYRIIYTLMYHKLHTIYALPPYLS